MRGDGDGWTTCAEGHRHWGLHGAAGLLLRAPDDVGSVHVLMQHRAPWTADGGTWGIPGGARDTDESAEAAALREAWEEAELDLGRVAVRDRFVDDHGDWSYTTVVADTDGLQNTRAQRESVELRWVAERDVATLPLHPGFALTWPRLAATPVTLVVDVANVVGARPTGWWRDRAGSTAAFLERLVRTRGRTAALPSGAFVSIRALVGVVEGAARRVDDLDALRVVRAGGTGDDAVVGVHRELLLTDGERPLVVTSDRGLRSRLGPQDAPAASWVGAGWLWNLLEDG